MTPWRARRPDFSGLLVMVNDLTVLERPRRESSPVRPFGAGFALEAMGATVLRGWRTVVRDVSLAVSPGEIVALRGSNGAGKTTLLQCLAGALCLTRGQILWFGDPAARSPAKRKQVGFLAHESGLYASLTVRENLLFAGRMFEVPDLAKRVDRLIAEVGLERGQDQLVAKISRGQRQKLAIARAVIHEPSILLLDEPFTSLDADGCRWLKSLLAEMRQKGCAIVIASHGGDDQAFDQVIALDKGRP